MKRCALFALFALCACANPGFIAQESTPALLSAVPAAPLTQPSESGAALVASAPSPSVVSNLQLATSYPCSLGPKFENDSSVLYVIEHMDEAHPLLLEMLKRGEVHAHDRAFRLLVIAGRPESVPVMESLLLSTEAYETTISSAGAYLGLHPSSEAFEVLVRALRSTKTPTLFGATLGLMERKDKAACAPLRAELERPDDSQRYYVIQAAGELGCLTKQELAGISKIDKSADIRAKARELTKTNKGSLDDD